MSPILTCRLHISTRKHYTSHAVKALRRNKNMKILKAFTFETDFLLNEQVSSGEDETTCIPKQIQFSGKIVSLTLKETTFCR